MIEPLARRVIDGMRAAMSRSGARTLTANISSMSGGIRVHGGEPGGRGRVVHEDVDRAEGLEGSLGDHRRGTRIAQVGLHDDRFMGEVAGDGREPCEASRHEGHPRAGAIESHRGRGADPRDAPVTERGSALEDRLLHGHRVRTVRCHRGQGRCGRPPRGGPVARGPIARVELSRGARAGACGTGPT